MGPRVTGSLRLGVFSPPVVVVHGQGTGRRAALLPRRLGVSSCFRRLCLCYGILGLILGDSFLGTVGLLVFCTGGGSSSPHFLVVSKYALIIALMERLSALSVNDGATHWPFCYSST